MVLAGLLGLSIGLGAPTSCGEFVGDAVCTEQCAAGAPTICGEFVGVAVCTEHCAAESETCAGVLGAACEMGACTAGGRFMAFRMGQAVGWVADRA